MCRCSVTALADLSGNSITCLESIPFPSLVVKVTDLGLADHEFESSNAEDTPCSGGRCSLNKKQTHVKKTIKKSIEATPFSLSSTICLRASELLIVTNFSSINYPTQMDLCRIETGTCVVQRKSGRELESYVIKTRLLGDLGYDNDERKYSYYCSKMCYPCEMFCIIASSLSTKFCLEI
ncbi:hypothetical protein TNCV_4865801 [Trichonephila clavipes]|nr:hypothetical protein TNCV_4865801 [Trichonephila clavipes]